MRRYLIAMLAAGAVASAQPARADQWDRSFTVSGAATLSMQTYDGRVLVHTWDKPQVDVRVTTKGWRIGTQVRVTAEQNGDDIHITVTKPHFQFSITWDRYAIQVEVWMPRTGKLEARSGDGPVSVEDFAGRLDVTTSDGAIAVTGFQGNAVLHTSDGEIHASGMDGTLDASTRDGRIRAQGRFDVLRLRTGDGPIVAQADAGSKVASDWSLHTSDGSLTLRVPPGIDADLDAHTGDGRITVDLPVEVSGSMSRSRLHGRLGKGGGHLEMVTGDGSIVVERAAI